MILLLDTSTPTCKLTLDERTYDWEANRELTNGLLGFIEEKLSEAGAGFADISGIGVFKGPGSFTGLRIGITVLNTIADAQNIPIVGVTGEDWERQARERIAAGENDQLVLPFYGGEANITKPRK